MPNKYIPFEKLRKGNQFLLSATAAGKLGLNHRDTFEKPVLVTERITACLQDKGELTHCPNPGDVIVDTTADKIIKLPHTNFQVQPES